MGLFRVDMEVANPERREFRRITPIVDTGATYSMLPSSLLQELGITPDGDKTFTLADGVERKYEMGEARFRFDGNLERTTPVIFGPDSICLLGAVSLQVLGLIPDTTNERLIPTPELYLVSMT